MLGETNGFEGILVADLFYVVTPTDTVRCYITSPEKADRVQERNPSASPKSLCHTRKKGRPFLLNGGLFPPSQELFAQINTVGELRGLEEPH